MSTKVKVANKEADKTNSAGATAVYKLEKERKQVSKALSNDKELVQNVMDYIFGGKEVDESPLADIRKK